MVYLFQSIILIYHFLIHALIQFHSPLLLKSLLISFPIGTKMFYLPM